MKSKIPKPVGCVSMVWSPVNQAYFIMWHDQVVSVISERAEAVWEFERITQTGRFAKQEAI